jgi:signal transduction histidine kinase
MFALASVTFFFVQSSGIMPPIGTSWLPLLLLGEAGALFALVMWDRARVALGVWFLPAALGWFMVVSIAEQAIVMMTTPAEALMRFGREGLPGVGFEAIFLVVPVILATWQYGRKGLVIALMTLAAGIVILTPLVGRDPAVTIAYLVASLGRLTMIALVGYVVLQLVNGLRAEHQDLAAANRRLAQRAATAEQLAESRERNRLARELHDTLAHSLTGLSVQLQAVETLMQVDPAGASIQLKQAQATVRSGIQESRRAIQALRASPLEDLGLSEALRLLCRRHAERTETTLACDIADVEALDPLSEQAVYRVGEAALANVERHAGATQVRVTLARLGPDGRLRLEIADDGIGFDLSAVPADRYGLTGMAEWAALAGGDLAIDTKPGQGALVSLELKA